MTEDITVYTLTVHDTHTFFTDNILVHNKLTEPCNCQGGYGGCTQQSCENSGPNCAFIPYSPNSQYGNCIPTSG